MEPAIEEFNLLYPNYLISSIDGSVEVVETCPRSDLDFRRLVVTGCMGYVFPREFAADSVAFYGKANSRPPMMYNNSETADKYYRPLALPDINIHYVAVPNRQTEFQMDLQSLLAL